jgi:hypothetical protein
MIQRRTQVCLFLLMGITKNKIRQKKFANEKNISTFAVYYFTNTLKQNR